MEPTSDNNEQATNSPRESLAALFRAFLHPGDNEKPVRWLKIVVIGIIVLYGWNLLVCLAALFNFFKCETCHWGIVTFGYAVKLLYIPCIFLFMYKRNSAGWLILFTDNLVAIVFTLVAAYIWIISLSSWITAFITYGPTLIFRAFFGYLLWREQMSRYFCLDLSTKRKFAIISLVITLVYTCALILYFL